MAAIINIVGNCYGRLKVITQVRPRGGRTCWLCECECGQKTYATTHNLRSGRRTSCGCGRSINGGQPKKGTPTEAAYRYYWTNAKGQAKFREKFFELTLNDFIRISSLPCTYCGDSPPEKTYHKQRQYRYKNISVYLNGLDRVDNDLGYTEDNVVSSCAWCNRAKNNLTLNQFQDQIRKLYARLIEIEEE